MIEVELRYKVHDPTAMLAVLEKHGVTGTGEQHIVDSWYTPSYVHSQVDEEEWFDSNHGIAYRIRKKMLPDGTTEVVMDSKQLTKANNHNTFKEEVVLHGDETKMQQFLKEKDYYNWLTVDKLRRNFASPKAELTIVMDTVAGIKDALGVDTVLEIEYNGEATRQQALKAIGSFAKTLGLDESALFEKSLTVESMRVLARFE